MADCDRSGTPLATTFAPASASLLLVEPDEARAEALVGRLGATPGLRVTRCATLAAARAHLSGTDFDAVLTAPHLPDGDGEALFDLRDALRLHGRFLVGDGANGLTARADAVVPADDAEALARRLADVLGLRTAPPAAEEEGLGVLDAQRLLDQLRREAGAVAHAINNPLTVLTGNAQLLLELARALDLDPALLRPIEDIEAASHQLVEAVDRLAALRQRLAAEVGLGDGLG